MILEKDVEADFVEHVESCGCLPLKLHIIGWAGWPDRMVLCPGGRVIFFELKAPDKKARKLQKYIHSLLKRLGFNVFVCDSFKKAKEKFDTIIQAA